MPSLELALTFAAIKCLGTKELSKHRHLIVAGAEHPVVVAVVGTAGTQKAVLTAAGQLVCERDTTRQTLPRTTLIIAGILALCGARQRTKIVEMLPTILTDPSPCFQVPQELVIVADQLLPQLKQPKPARGSLKFVYDLE